MFFAFQLYFNISWNNKAYYAAMLHISVFNIKMAPQKFTDFDFFLNARWYDSCHNLNKIVLNEVKDY